MPLLGETEFALIDSELGSSLDWSALNLVVCHLGRQGLRAPIELEDAHGKIKTPLNPTEISDLTEYFSANGEEISRQLANKKWVDRVKTFSGHRETVKFIVNAVKHFRECAHNNRYLTVEEMPMQEIEIVPE